MARFLRSTGRSKLRPPVVVNTAAAGFVAQTIRRTFAPALRQPRAAHSKLFPPTVLAVTPAAFLAPPLRRTLAPTVYRARVARSRLQPPLLTPVVAAAPSAPIKVRLVTAPRRQPVRYKLQPPSTLTAAAPTFVFAPIKTRLARFTFSWHQTRSLLRPPTVIGPAVVPPPGTPGQSDSYPLHQQPLGGGRWQDKPLEVRIREQWDDDDDVLIALLLSL